MAGQRTEPQRITQALEDLRSALNHLAPPPAEDLRAKSFSQLLDKDPPTWKDMSSGLSLVWPKVAGHAGEIPVEDEVAALGRVLLELWEKVGAEQLAEPSEAQMTARDWIQTVWRAVKRKREEEQRLTVVRRSRSPSHSGKAGLDRLPETPPTLIKSQRSQDGQIAAAHARKKLPPPTSKIKPTPSRISPLPTSVAGSLPQGHLRRSGRGLPRAPHDLGYTGRSPSLAAGWNEDRQVEEDDEDHATDTTTGRHRVPTSNDMSLMSGRGPRASSRATSELTTIIDSEEDEQAATTVRNRGKGKAKVPKHEDTMSGDDSDGSDLVVVETKSTSKDRIEPGAAVVADFATAECTGHGEWPGVVLDPETSKGAWWESSIAGEPHPDAHLVKCLPTGGDWSYIKAVRRWDSKNRPKPTVKLNKSDKRLFNRGNTIAGSKEKLKAWLDKSTDIEVELEAEWKDAQEREEKESRKREAVGKGGEGTKRRKT